MKFRHENTRTGRTFQCQVQCGQCSANKADGSRCRNRVCIGRKMCWQHRKQKLGLTVKKSTIANAGKGLFATKLFRRDDTIGRYAGELISNAEHNRRYGGTDDDHGPYSVQTRNSQGRIVDASCRRGLMSMANGTRRKSQANARFVDNLRPDGTIKVKATRAIRPGTEILIHYGRDYFATAGVSEHSTR